MKRLLIIGSGYMARRIIPLLTNHYRVYALMRNDTHKAWMRAQGVTVISGDLDDRAKLSRVAGLADVVLHFAPPPGEGERDTRTSHLLAVLAQSAVPRRFVYISTSGVYGDCSGARVSETHVLNPQSARAQRRVDAELQIRDVGTAQRRESQHPARTRHLRGRPHAAGPFAHQHAGHRG